MKALSIKQPWAWLICAGYKDVENRNWRIGRKSRHGPYSSRDQADFTIELPCRIYVHAGKSMDYEGLMAVIKLEIGDLPLKQRAYLNNNELIIEKMRGAIIGEVDITGCVTESDSPWFVGKYGFILGNPILYKVPIPCNGKLGFFEPDIKFMPEGK